MRKFVVIGSVVVLLIATLFFTRHQGTRTTLTTPETQISENESDQRFAYTTLVDSRPLSIECKYMIGGGDSDSCQLFSRDASGGRTNLHLHVDSVSNSLYISGDKKHILIIQEGFGYGAGSTFPNDKATIIDVATGAAKDVYVTEPGTSLGVYTDLPSFNGRASWVDNSTISVSVYGNSNNRITFNTDTNTEVESEPLKKVRIKIQ